MSSARRSTAAPSRRRARISSGTSSLSPGRRARRTFTKTRSDLERDFIPLARAAGLPRPLTQQIVSGHEVDFYWPELGLVVESDGLRYHRTPAQQAKDRRRDQTHTAAGLTP